MPLQTVSLYETLGGLDLPVEAADVGDTLNALDPGVHLLAELFKAAINGELTDAWQKVVGSTSPVNAGVIGSAHPLYNTLPVADTLELEPTPAIMTQRKAVWPMLCVHRMGRATYDDIALQLTRRTQTWGLHYILGPLDVADLHKLNKICVAVTAIVAMVIRDRGHRAYQNGAVQFFPDTEAFTSIRLVSHEGPGQAKFSESGDSTLYYAVSMELETTETVKDNPDAFGVFDAVDYEIGGGGDDGILPGLIYAQTDVTYQQP
jgi:hypothetical protein